MSTRPTPLLALPSYLAGHVARIVRRPLRDHLAAQDLQLPHYAVLAALSEGADSQKDLARRLDIDKSHMVKFVDHLERRGFVARAPWPADRRRYRVSLTSAGKELFAEVDAIARRVEQEVLHALSEREREQLVDLLGRVVEFYDRDRLSRSS